MTDKMSNTERCACEGCYRDAKSQGLVNSHLTIPCDRPAPDGKLFCWDCLFWQTPEEIDRVRVLRGLKTTKAVLLELLVPGYEITLLSRLMDDVMNDLNLQEQEMLDMIYEDIGERYYRVRPEFVEAVSPSYAALEEEYYTEGSDKDAIFAKAVGPFRKAVEAFFNGN